MILSCQNICKSFGEKIILKDASFHIEDREKAALIGNNGAGKTTLLRIIMHELSPDSGNVVLAKDKNIGYLAQYQDIHGHHTNYEELISTKQHIIDMENRLRSLEQEMKTTTGDALDSLMNTYTRLSHQFELENGYAYKSEIMGVLKGLGFTEEDFERQIETLSGGQKTRVALGKLLLASPDILLLDEPTNHLDMESISWLETYLLNYPGAVFIVSHDRYFLDKVVTKVVEIEAGNMRMYSGNYSAYALKKAQLRDSQLKAWMNQQREIIYGQRRKVLDGEDISAEMHNMLKENIESSCKQFLAGDVKDEWDFGALRRHYLGWLTTDADFHYTVADYDSISQESIADMLYQRGMDVLNDKEQRYGAPLMRELERICLLKCVDRQWMDHIDNMDQLRQGIALRGYGQKDPVVEYRIEGFDMFDQMVDSIRESSIKMLLTIAVRGAGEATIVRCAPAPSTTPMVPTAGSSDLCCGTQHEPEQLCGKFHSTGCAHKIKKGADLK